MTELNTINNTLFVGKVFHLYNECLSTNDMAQNWLKTTHNTAPKESLWEGSVFCTFNQTAGRGQYGNTWISEPFKNIAMSIVMKPRFLKATEQFYLNKAIALSMYDVINKNTEGGVSVKWANDIFIYNKKASGILIQNTLNQGFIDSSIIGIGVNVNQENFENLPHATSLYRENNLTFDLFKLVEAICVAVEQRYLELKAHQFAALDREYLSKLFRYGEEALYQYPNGQYFQGKIVGLSETGKLMIDSKAGLEYFDIKEIKFVL